MRYGRRGWFSFENGVPDVGTVEIRLKRFLWLGLGYLLGIGFAVAAIAAVSLAAIGVGGHFWAVRDRGVANVLGFDPSQVAVRSLGPGVVALALLFAIVVIARRIGRDTAPPDRESGS